MGVTGSSGVTQVSGNVNVANEIPVPGTGQTPWHLKPTLGTSVATEYTVPTGKTLYIYGIMCGDGANVNVQLYETDGTTLVYRLQSLANDTAIISGAVPIHTLSAGEFLKMLSSVNNVPCSLWGVLVDD